MGFILDAKLLLLDAKGLLTIHILLLNLLVEILSFEFFLFMWFHVSMYCKDKINYQYKISYII